QAPLPDEAGSELDRQRNPIEAPACLRDDGHVVVGQIAGPAARRRALEEDLDSGERLDGLHAHAGEVGGALEGAETMGVLALDAKSLSARGQQVHAWRAQEKMLRKSRSRFDHMLAV